MLERAILRDEFAEMLAMARKVAAEYDRLGDAISDPGVRETLQRLSRDQHRNVELTRRLLEIVEE